MLTENACGILIFGLNGSGKTTVGGAAARLLGFFHMDVEDYYFINSPVPYSVSRTRDEAAALMEADVKKYREFVLSAVRGDFGGEITAAYRLAAYIDTPREVRLERIKRRSVEKFGNRVLEGGDMYEQERRFYEFAVARAENYAAECSGALACPVIYIDGTQPPTDNAARIAAEYRKIAAK